MQESYRQYMLEQLEKLLQIPAVTGYSREIEDYLFQTCEALGYAPQRMRKGGVFSKIAGEGNDLMMMAHGDDIGLMVHQILPNGHLRVTNIGGLHAQYADQENVTVITRDGRRYTGVIRLQGASIHVYDRAHTDQARHFDSNTEVVLDEDVFSAEDTAALGIRVGDIIALDPRFRVTPNGFIKSRFLDDKASVAILLTYMKYLKDQNLTPSRGVWAHFALFEEIGHGGCTGIPDAVEEVMALDIGPIGETTSCSEHKVFLCAKDAAFPYHYETLTRLIDCAEKNEIPYTVDVLMPSYGSDADAALRAGHDVRHSLIGPGVNATHGYEHTHIDALTATFDLICAYTL